MGTSSVSAEIRTAATGSVTQSARFGALKEQLDQAVQTRLAKGYWDSGRDVDVSAHDEFLAISWRGKVSYWAARAWDRKLRQLDKVRSSLPEGARVDREKQLDDAAKDIRDRFQHRHDGPYALESFVFFKTSNIAPPSLVHMASHCVEAFQQAPLHTHFVIHRFQGVVDKGEALRFCGFEAERKTPRDPADLCKGLIEQIFPKEARVYKDSPPPGCPLCVFLAALGILLTLILVGVFAYPDSRSAALDWLGIAKTDELDGFSDRLDALEARYQALELEAQRPGVVAASGPDVTAGAALDQPDPERGDSAETRGQILAELAELRQALADAGRPVPDRDLPLGLPPCLPVVATGSPHGGAPGYLYAITLGRAGITVSEPTGVHALSAEDRADPDFPTTLPQASSPLPIPVFEALVAPVSARAAAAGCAHYVLLSEDETSGWAGYIAQREAVERHFYVYRPRP